MEVTQGLRSVGIKARKSFRTAGATAKDVVSSISVDLFAGIAGVIIVGVILYFFVGSKLIHEIDDDRNFAPPTITQGQSAATAMAAALMEREVDRHGWVANDPFYLPSVVLDNMPNFQSGIKEAVELYTEKLRDNLGRQRGSSEKDADLVLAKSRLGTDPAQWVWDPTESALPRQPAEDLYRTGIEALQTYNRRLAQGQASFDPRADNLRATLDAIASDLGAISQTIDDHVSEQSGFFWHNQVDDKFYRAKGKIYAHYMILKALRSDFESVINERPGVAEIYDRMLISLGTASELQAMVILNGKPDAQATPCHLCGQGFYLLRARTNLREITDILRD